MSKGREMGASLRDRAGHEPSPDGLGHPVAIPSAELFALSERIQSLRPCGEDFRNWEGWNLQREAVLACGYTVKTDARNEDHWSDPTGKFSQDPKPLCRWEEARKLLPVNDRSLELKLSFSNDDCWPAISIRWWEREETDPTKWMGLVVRGATEAACLTAAALELHARDAQAIERGTAEPERLGPQDESAVVGDDAP